MRQERHFQFTRLSELGSQCFHLRSMPLSLSPILIGCFIVSVMFMAQSVQAQGEDANEVNDDRPNILILSAEDIGPELGCYGDSMANTPVIDQFAKTALRYKVAWSNYPVCAPARTTIITGAYACVGGAGNMRSNLPLPSDMVMFPSLLREAGYFCTNNSKEDYNYSRPAKKSAKDSVWDVSSRTAHYKNRKKGQPFFAVFNYTKTHESKIRNRPHEAVTDPASLTLPPFWPDAPEVRTDLGQYYDNIAKMDGWFKNKIAELEKQGVADNTIVFFFGDHGSGMPRFKRHAGDTGYHVAMMVHIPPKFRTGNNSDYLPGGVSDRLVGFVDLGPTVLSLAGIEPPKSMLGQPWFGKYQSPNPEFLFGFRERMDERNDLSHCIRDQQFQYTVNYMPHLPAGQNLDYQMQTPTTAKWFELFKSGELNEVQSQYWKPRRAEEFYDLAKDPWAIDNLIDSSDANIQQQIERFRQAHQKQTLDIKDLGFIPEPISTKLRDGSTSLEELRAKVPSTFAAAQLSALKSNDANSDDDVIKLLSGGSPEEQSWALVGTLLRKERMSANPKAVAAVEALLGGDSFTAADAADCLLTLGGGDEQRCIKVLLRFANAKEEGVTTAIRAVNSLERHQHLLTDAQRKAILALPTEANETTRSKATFTKLFKNF